MFIETIRFIQLVIIVLHFFTKVCCAFKVEIDSGAVKSRVNDNAFPEAENCSSFDINCLERKLTGNFLSSDSKVNRFKYQCSLRNIKRNIIWWTHPNGSLALSYNRDYQNSFLDLSFRRIGNDDLYNEVTKIFQSSGMWNIEAFSIAENMLTAIPFTTLSLINGTLVYLSLKGNNFGLTQNESDSKARIPRLRFPQLGQLKGLDLSSCNIKDLDDKAFGNLPNLESLFLSNNKLMAIESDTFKFLSKLKHLDLSQIESVVSTNTPYAVPTVEAYLNVFEGLTIAEDAFVTLLNLEYLDFSYTKIARSSVKAFPHLGEALRYLSLCFTSIPIIGKGIFSNTSLKAVDLSGNAYAAYHIGVESFEGIDDTLEFLAFEKSNIKSLHWLKNLTNLKVLKLGGNNINYLNNATFKTLQDLQLLDLSSNHIGNWYYRVFEKNKNLMVLNLRQNNINLITPEMFRDFSSLSYLAIGRNNFVCDCNLRNIIDVAATNNNVADCIRNIMHKGLRENSTEKTNILHKSVVNNVQEHDVISAAVNSYHPLLEKSHKNMVKVKELFPLNMNTMEVVTNKTDDEEENIVCRPKNIISENNFTQFSFQLLDYTKDDYWCFNGSEYLEVVNVTSCSSRSYDTQVEHAKKGTYAIVYGSILGIATLLLSSIAYYKRWHIRYYYFLLKNSSILRFYLKKEFNTKKDLPKCTYDIFVSYSDNDREWVLQELLPNIEDTEQITVCLHERDFQVGMTILENIISCMDKSTCVLLILSNSFLSSQWCLFELNLAQHRLVEIKRENLILILLEDIPKIKRPRTLQYLMHLKTYIKWPASSKHQLSPDVAEQRNFFWKRLKKTLVDISFNKRTINI